MCCLLVSGFLTEITQQIHSLRASGVMSSHFARAAGSEMRTFRKSTGTLCTAPGEIGFLVMDSILHRYAISLGSPRMLSGLGRREKPIWTTVFRSCPRILEQGIVGVAKAPATPSLPQQEPGWPSNESRHRRTGNPGLPLCCVSTRCWRNESTACCLRPKADVSLARKDRIKNS